MGIREPLVHEIAEKVWMINEFGSNNMYVIEGYSHKEIGEMLGVTETTSRTQLSRARIWLQNKIKERENV